MTHGVEPEAELDEGLWFSDEPREALVCAACCADGRDLDGHGLCASCALNDAAATQSYVSGEEAATMKRLAVMDRLILIADRGVCVHDDWTDVAEAHMVYVLDGYRGSPACVALQTLLRELRVNLGGDASVSLFTVDREALSMAAVSLSSKVEEWVRNYKTRTGKELKWAK